MKTENQARLAQAMDKAKKEQARIESNRQARLNGRILIKIIKLLVIKLLLRRKLKMISLIRLKKLRIKVKELAFDPDSAKFRNKGQLW